MKNILFILIFFPFVFRAQINHVVFPDPIILSAFDAAVYEQYDVCVGMADHLNISNSPNTNISLNTAPTCYHASLGLTTPGFFNLYVSSQSVEFVHSEKNLLNEFGMTQSGSVLTALEIGDLIDENHDFFYQGVAFHNGAGTPNGHEVFHQSDRFVGFRWFNGSNHFYGWFRVHTSYNGYELICTISEYALETNPNTPIVAGSTFSLNVPNELNENYSNTPNGIYLNWTPIANAQGCQVRGGPAGGSDPHNFIVTGNEPNELFINGNSLTEGQEYQWKVRCATGVNPYSGISDWSDYDYFIYQP